MRSAPDLSDGIRPWRFADWDALCPLMHAFLTEHYAAGGDFRATPGNVEAFVRMGIRAAAKADPCLLAYDGGAPVGFCLWLAMPETGLDLRERVCLGIGTYIVPERRRQGWSKRLRTAAKEVARAAGYTRADGVAIDRRGLAAGQAIGGVAVGVTVHVPLQLDDKEAS